MMSCIGACGACFLHERPASVMSAPAMATSGYAAPPGRMPESRPTMIESRPPSDEALLGAAVDIARAAGGAVMRFYDGQVVVEHKVDRSPVTVADREAEAVIASALRRLTPDIPVIAEEEVSSGAANSAGERFWLVDPLDGTKEFLEHNGDFTVNIALITRGRPVLGVVYAPALNRRFAGAEHSSAFVERGGALSLLRCAVNGAHGLTVVSSRSHSDDAALTEFLAGLEITTTRGAGSSLKFCIVASGEADVYPRLGRTMEWDTAAGHAVLRAVGGEIWSIPDGRPLSYGKPRFENPHFVAVGLTPPTVLKARFNLVSQEVT